MATPYPIAAVFGHVLANRSHFPLHSAKFERSKAENDHAFPHPWPFSTTARENDAENGNDQRL